MTNSKTRVALGSVSNIRALPSREISQILIELPEEFHVPLTTLAYGQEVLVMRSPLNVETPLGVRNVDESPTTTGPAPAEAAAPAGMVHGLVSLVRAVPSRMVTVMHVDIPSDQHIAVTTLLFGAVCMVVPCQLPPGTKYGLIAPGPASGDTASPAHGHARSQEPPARDNRPAIRRGLGAPSHDGPREPLKWVSARCQEDHFQAFLGVRTEAAARQEVRIRCGMESCSELNHRLDAVRLFLREIYNPFMAYERRREAQDRARHPAASSSEPDEAPSDSVDELEPSPGDPDDGDQDDEGDEESPLRQPSPFSALVHR